MSSSESASPRDSKSLLDVVPPITGAGLAKYQGILAVSGVHEIIVSGTFPKDETTQRAFGTFESNGAFKPIEFLSVRSDLNPSSSNGPTGRIT
jgi:hypothetical protein